MTEGEAKKLMLENYRSALLQAIILRYQSLTIISGIAAAFMGVVGATINPTNNVLMSISLSLSTLITVTALGRYISLTRTDINKLTKKIDELDGLDVKKPLQGPGWSKDYWPEALFICLTISLTCFIFAVPLYSMF